MSKTFRAAYYSHPKSGDETRLTGPEHAYLDDDALRAQALTGAREAGLLDEDETDPDAAYPRLTRALFDAGLKIGQWTE